VLLGHDLLGVDGVELALLEGVELLVLLDTHRSELERVADVVIPVRHAAEKDGSYTNHAGRVQRTFAAVEPAFEAVAEGEALEALGARLGLEGFTGVFDVAAVSEELSREVPAFAGRALAALSEQGAPAAGRESAER
jgi:predicted molibdopterin-dependent oxidoreductase YjgC